MLSLPELELFHQELINNSLNSNQFRNRDMLKRRDILNKQLTRELLIPDSQQRVQEELSTQISNTKNKLISKLCNPDKFIKLLNMLTLKFSRSKALSVAVTLAKPKLFLNKLLQSNSILQPNKQDTKLLNSKSNSSPLSRDQFNHKQFCMIEPEKFLLKSVLSSAETTKD